MKMSASQTQELLSKIIDMEQKQEKWIESLPREISSVFYDNDYTEGLRTQINTLISFVFGDWSEDVGYFLYESAPHVITTQKAEYTINNLKEYVDYMVAEGFCEDDRK